MSLLARGVRCTCQQPVVSGAHPFLQCGKNYGIALERTTEVARAEAILVPSSARRTKIGFPDQL
jgi:hypothetical protein